MYWFGNHQKNLCQKKSKNRHRQIACCKVVYSFCGKLQKFLSYSSIVFLRVFIPCCKAKPAAMDFSWGRADISKQIKYN